MGTKEKVKRDLAITNAMDDSHSRKSQEARTLSFSRSILRRSEHATFDCEQSDAGFEGFTEGLLCSEFSIDFN